LRRPRAEIVSAGPHTLVRDHPDRQVRGELGLAPRLPEADPGLEEVELGHAPADVVVQATELRRVRLGESAGVRCPVLRERQDGLLEGPLGAGRRDQRQPEKSR
jgi:hypothetical protein